MKKKEEKKSLLEKMGATDYSKDRNKDIPDKKPQEEFIQKKPNETEKKNDAD
jgi:hypothetical protein